MNPTCQSMSLEQILLDQCDAATESKIQHHLETCSECQQRLETLAADPQTWNDAGKNLSTISQFAVTRSIKKKLQESSSFLVNSHVFRADGAEPDSSVSATATPSWKRLLDPPKHPEMLGQIDHFEIESKIGQGGMGIVLKGFDRELDRAVAIKVLSPHLACNGTARKRFAREAQAAAAVVHPNVVPIYSVNQTNVERPYIAMQLVSGRSLQSVIEDDGPLSVLSVVRIAIQIADGLSAAHEQGLIHRDVKPANVLTERDVTRVMITDFGLARAVDDVGMTQTGWLTGTPHYMSPEQAMGDDVDPRSDLFSLGSLLYFLATGREPFRAQRSYGVIQKIINEQHEAPNQVNAEVSQTLSNVIEKLLAKEREQRFQSAAELADYLRDYLAHLQQPNLAKPPVKVLHPRRQQAMQQPRRPWSLLTWVLGSIAAAGSVLVLGGLLWLTLMTGFKPDTPPRELSGSLSSIPPVGAGAPSPTTEAVVPVVIPELSDDSLFKEMNDLDRDMGELEEMFLVPTGLPSMDRFFPSGNSLSTEKVPLPPSREPAKEKEKGKTMNAEKGIENGALKTQEPGPLSPSSNAFSWPPPSSSKLMESNNNLAAQPSSVAMPKAGPPSLTETKPTQPFQKQPTNHRPTKNNHSTEREKE